MAIKHVKHYGIIRKIGSGGMATVYEAVDKRTGNTVALKILHPHLADRPTYVERFLREARVAMNLDSPHIAKVLDYGHDEVDGDRVYYIAMEHIPGVTLAQFIQSERILSVSQVMNIAYQVAQALAEANRHGIVHRDIKPENIMITPDGTVKVMDFGIAREILADSLTKTGVFVGTPQYSSPEQALGEKDVDIRSDIYSLGVVLYQLLTGTVPFQADTPQALLNRVMQGNPVPVESHRVDLPTEVSAIVGKMLQRDPDERFQTPEELMEVLKPLIAPSAEDANAEMATIVAPMVAEGAKFHSTVPRGKRRKALVPIMISSILVLFLAIVAMAFSDRIFPSGKPTVTATANVFLASPTISKIAADKVLPTSSPTSVVIVTSVPVATRTTTPTQTRAPLPDHTRTPQMPTASPTPVVKAVVLPKTLNVRSGPGTSYPVIGKVHRGETFEVQGRNAKSTWIQMLLNPGSLGWVYGEFVKIVSGDVSSVAVETVTVPTSTATASPTPTWTSTPSVVPPAHRPRRKASPTFTPSPSPTSPPTWTPKPPEPTWTPRPVVTPTPPPSISGSEVKSVPLSWKDLLAVVGFLTLLDAGSASFRGKKM